MHLSLICFLIIFFGFFVFAAIAASECRRLVIIVLSAIVIFLAVDIFLEKQPSENIAVTTKYITGDLVQTDGKYYREIDDDRIIFRFSHDSEEEDLVMRKQDVILRLNEKNAHASVEYSKISNRKTLGIFYNADEKEVPTSAIIYLPAES